MTRRLALLLVTMSSTVALAAQSAPPPTQTPVPRPFPGASQPPAPAPASTAGMPGATMAGAPADGAQFDPLLRTIKIYPGAQLLHATDAGPKQKVFTFGTNETYGSVVTFYKTLLRKSGEEVLRAPGIHQFDLGGFDGNTMVQRPSIVVKDYTSPDPTGYVHVEGIVEKRFRTLIQIIPTGGR